MANRLPFQDEIGCGELVQLHFAQHDNITAAPGMTGDCTSGDDQIDLRYFNFASFAAVQTLFIQHSDARAKNLGNGDLVVVHNVQMGQLTAGGFIP